MLSKVSSTLGLSSASIAASESEFSISSSSKSASLDGVSAPSAPSLPLAPLAPLLCSLPRSCAALNGVARAGAAGGAGVCARGGAWDRRHAGHSHDRLPIGADRRRHGLGVGT